MAPSAFSTTAVSAPGKVLLSGGYLVLERKYTGTVFALDARIHAVVQQLRRTHRRHPSSMSGSGIEDQWTGRSVAGEGVQNEDVIVVRSPQFTEAVWEYFVQGCDDRGGVRVVQKDGG